MTVQKQGVAARRRRRWFAIPAFMVLAVWAMLLREGGSLYWGPLDSDLTNGFYPWQVFIHRWITRGVFPFWDPHVFGGYPTLETQQMLALNPVHLATLWLPPNFGLIAMTALNTLVGCAGMAWGLWRWGRCSAMAAALGAGLYVFGALFAVRVMAGHFTVVAAMAWWPLAAFSVLRIARGVPSWERACPQAHKSPWRFGIKNYFFAFLQSFRSPSTRRFVAISALSHAMVCLAGGPQYIVYLFYIDLVIIAAAARQWAWMPVLAVVAAVWVLALVVSAPQWLPALWYLPYSVRGVSSGGATGWSLEPLYNIWFETIMPFPFGDDITFGHLHYKNVWETALYPGSIALVLSAALIIRVVWWRVKRVVGQKGDGLSEITPLGLAGVVVALMGLYMMAGGWLPGFSGFREPLKARAVVAFGFAVMAAAAFDGLARRPATWRSWLIVATLVMWGCITSAWEYVNPIAFRDLIKSFGLPPFDSQAAPTYAAMLADPTDAAQRFFLAVQWATGGALLCVLAILVLRRNPCLAVVLLFSAGLIDPFLAHAPVWLGRHSWSRNELPEPVEKYFAPRLAVNEGELPWRVILHSSIINRTHHMEGLYEFHGYDPIMPAFATGRMLVKGILDLPGEQRAQSRGDLLERVGVRYDAREGLEIGFGGDALSSAGEVLVAPEATLFDVSRKVVAGSPGINLFGPDLSGIHYVLPSAMGGNISDEQKVSSSFKAEVAGLVPAEVGTTSAMSQLLPGETLEHLETGRPDEVGVRVGLERPALVVYKGTWTPGWRVFIDGEDKGRALFANNWMSGAIVPKGGHEVVFRYRPVMWIPSLWMSGLGIIGVVGLLIMGRKKNVNEIRERVRAGEA